MKNSLVTHCCYLLVTVGTFVAGSQYARSSASSSKGEGDQRNGNARSRAGSSHRLSALPFQSDLDKGSENSVTGEVVDGDWQIAPGRGGKTRGERGLRFEKFAAEIGPLAKEQIEALVLASIKSPDPLERRRAFDRLLQEMESETFTVAQAMIIRKTMHDNGASGEQWRLFDYAWGANDPSAAIAYIDEIPEQYRSGYLGNMLPGLASADPQTAINLFEGLAPELQRNLRRRLYEGLIDNDVAVATDYIFDATDLDSYNWKPMDTLTREIVAEKGLGPTLEWAAELPEGPLRGSAWSAAYAHWGSRQPELAVQSIIEMPPSADKNQAINGFISGLAHQDGEAAAIWAGEITSPGMREEAMVRAGIQFYKQDQQAATEWFTNSGLPATRWNQITGVGK